MMTEDEFYEWYLQRPTEYLIDDAYENYIKALKYDALVEHGVDNWPGYEDATQSLDNEILINN